MSLEKLSQKEQRDTLHMLLHASSKLKLLAKDEDFRYQSLTRFIAAQIDDWCLTVVREIDAPEVHISDDNICIAFPHEREMNAQIAKRA